MLRALKDRDGEIYRIESDIPIASTQDVKGTALETSADILVLKHIINGLLEKVYKLEKNAVDKK